MCRWYCASVDTTYLCRWCGTRYCEECLHGDFHGIMRDALRCQICRQPQFRGRRVEYYPVMDEGKTEGKRAGKNPRLKRRSRSSSPRKRAARSSQSPGKRRARSASPRKRSRSRIIADKQRARTQSVASRKTVSAQRSGSRAGKRATRVERDAPARERTTDKEVAQGKSAKRTQKQSTKRLGVNEL